MKMKKINLKAFFIIFFPTIFILFVILCIKYTPFGDFMVIAAIPPVIGLSFWLPLALPILFAEEIIIKKNRKKVEKVSN